jgi:hypothetical protein
VQLVWRSILFASRSCRLMAREGRRCLPQLCHMDRDLKANHISHSSHVGMCPPNEIVSDAHTSRRQRPCEVWYTGGVIGAKQSTKTVLRLCLETITSENGTSPLNIVMDYNGTWVIHLILRGDNEYHTGRYSPSPRSSTLLMPWPQREPLTRLETVTL